MTKKESGFFIKSGQKYDGPFLRLKEARDHGTSLNLDYELYHGTLKYLDGEHLEKVDANCLSLISKLIK